MRPTFISLTQVLATIAVLGGCAEQRPPSQKSLQGTVLSLTNLGVKCDGVTDDTAAIRAAITSVAATGATLQFPHGVCITHGTIYVGSHIHVIGNGTTLLAALPWNDDHKQRYALMENTHYEGGAVVDTDISVSSITFDYGAVAQLATPGGGKHALRFEFAHDLVVEANTFQIRGAEDAVAGLGVDNMLVQDNHAYDFRNCAYDFWYGPSKVKLTNNYAETTTSAQMVNFNPERTAGDSSGMVAQGFVMTGNTLVATGPKAVPIQLEPLGPGTSVRDVSVSGNTLKNVYIVLRGNVRDAVVKSNTITDVTGGASAIETYPHFGATADSMNFSENKIIDAHTIASELGVIRLEATHSTINGNTVQNAQRAAPDIYQGSFAGR